MRLSVLLIAVIAAAVVVSAAEPAHSVVKILKAPVSAGFKSGTFAVALEDIAPLMAHAMGVASPSGAVYTGEGAPAASSVAHPRKHLLVVIAGANDDINVRGSTTTFVSEHASANAWSTIATLLSGHLAAEHGVLDHAWFDHETKKTVSAYSGVSTQSLVPHLADSVVAALGDRAVVVSASAGVALASLANAHKDSSSKRLTIGYDAATDSYVDASSPTAFKIARSELLKTLEAALRSMGATTASVSNDLMSVTVRGATFDLRSASSADSQFFAELQLLPAVASSASLDALTANKAVLTTLVLSGLERVTAHYGSSSPHAAIARDLTNSMLARLASSSTTTSDTIVSVALLDTAPAAAPTTHTRSRRATDSDSDSDADSDTVDPNWPPIFQITFWMSLTLLIALSATAYAVAYIDPGSETVLYRTARSKTD
jgi:hypothetical protein